MPALLPVTPEQAEGVRTLPDALHRHDPVDRLLVARTRALGLTFLTADRVLLGLDLPFVVDATRWGVVGGLRPGEQTWSSWRP